MRHRSSGTPSCPPSKIPVGSKLLSEGRRCETLGEKMCLLPSSPSIPLKYLHISLKSMLDCLRATARLGISSALGPALALDLGLRLGVGLTTIGLPRGLETAGVVFFLITEGRGGTTAAGACGIVGIVVVSTRLARSLGVSRPGVDGPCHVRDVSALLLFSLSESLGPTGNKGMDEGGGGAERGGSMTGE